MAEQGNYRAFRQGILDQVATDRAERRWTGRRGARSGEAPFATGRAAISAFRAEVAERASELAAESAGHAAWVRRALRLSSTLALQPDAKAIAEKWVYFFLPIAQGTRRARRLLGQSGTFEGRRLVFGRYVHRTLSWQQVHYGESLDFALRWFEPVASWEEFERWERTSEDVLRAARGLGLSTVAEVHAAFNSGAVQQRRELILLLVAEGVIRSVAELPWVEVKEGSSYSHARLESEDIQRLRGTVRGLLGRGVGREQVAAILRYPLSPMAPETLHANMELLGAAGIAEVTAVLSGVGDRLWRAPTATWRFIVDTLGAKTPGDIVKFRDLLDCHHELSADLAGELKARCRGLDELAGCQRLLAGLDPKRDDALSFVAHLRRLSAPPHSLDTAALARSQTYLGGGDSLPPFLQVLADHGCADADSVMEFQRCFRKVTAAALDRALRTQAAASCDEALAQRVGWVLQAGQGGYFHVYDHLVAALRLQGLVALQQIVPLAPLGIGFLRYLIEDRRLGSLKAIRDWYREAVGIEGYRGNDLCDAVDKLLLGDAFGRNHFGLLASNQHAVYAIVHSRIERSLGKWPWQADEVEKEVYREASRVLGEQMRVELLPALEQILQSTGGVILESLFDDEDPQRFDLASRLARLKPLLADLVAGRGPAGEHLSTMELDAIAVVYRSPQEFIRSTWPEVRGRETDLDGLRLSPSYDMPWRHARRRLRRELDGAGLHSLLRAAQFSGNFTGYPNMFTACQRLSPKQLRQNAAGASVETLALHLGSLLALAREDSTVSQWIREGFDVLTTMDQSSLGAYQRIGELVDLFNVVLPDALDAHAVKFIERLPEGDAAHWASRLGPEVPDLSGRALLHAMVARTRAKVMPVYLSWARRQFKLYEKDEDASQRVQLVSGVVSKHPAAYFAKKAVGLCTSGNVAMWKEARHGHLVVFDPVAQRMAGMAMLYVQQLDELDRSRRSLVIRGIHPTEDMLAAHDTRSIVESFFDVAVRIAEQNGLACVAFPALTGSHLMSNRDEVERDLKKRYVMRADSSRLGADLTGGQGRLRQAPQRVDARFCAYEEGSEVVGALYVIWRASEAHDEPTVPSVQRVEMA